MIVGWLIVACSPDARLLNDPAAPLRVPADRSTRGVVQGDLLGFALSAQRVVAGADRTFVTNGDNVLTLSTLGMIDGPIVQMTGVAAPRWATNPAGTDDLLVFRGQEDVHRVPAPYTAIGRTLDIAPDVQDVDDGAKVGRAGELLLVRRHSLATLGADGAVTEFHDAGDAGIARVTGHHAGAALFEVQGDRPGERVLLTRAITSDGTLGEPWTTGGEGLEEVVEFCAIGPDDTPRLLFREPTATGVRLFAVADPMGGGPLPVGDLSFESTVAEGTVGRGLGANAVCGDFDGDGSVDLALVDDALPGPQDHRGYAPAAIAVFRGPLEPGSYGTSDADLLFTVDAPDDVISGFGYAMHAADTDDDGIDELAVGAPYANDATGAAFVFEEPLRPWTDVHR